MATGGIFTIITNDGKQDRMLMATALLHERLRAINEFKQKRNGRAADDLVNLPTLLDIEKTHVLFTNAHFKPFAAIGFEYNKVRATSGNPSLGSSIQFSIPQFGDFFHDICCHAVLLQPTLNSTASIDSNAPLMRWAAFPGEALLQQVQMEVNGNPLDQYTFHATNMHREYRVAPNKITGWYRCVGQELPKVGYVNQPNWAFSGVAASAITSRVGAQVFTGAQTPTGQKVGNLELFVPLLFWFNTDVRLAIPSVAIPYGQRFININLASLNQLCGYYPRGAATWGSPQGSLSEASPTLSSIELYINNIFVNPEVHKIYIKRIGFSLIRVHRQQLYSTTTATAEVLLQQLKWPIEYLFVGMKITSYFASSTASTVAQYLDRWQSFSQVSDTTYRTTGQNVMQTAALASAGNYTIAEAVSGTEGKVTLNAGTLNQALVAGDVVKLNGAFFAVSTAAAAGAASFLLSDGPVDNTTWAAVDNATAYLVTVQGLSVTAQVLANTMDDVTITAHGITIYDDFPTEFYNAYTSYHYGGPNINTPTDSGLVFIPFCLFPGTYQPSGHINVSRAREFYLSYNSTVIDSNTPGTLVVIARAINFLLISDGSAVLRYST